MPWFKVDDSFESHPKVKGIPRNKRARAIGLWTLAGSWSARQLTDGFVPNYMLDELACTVADARALVAVDLWIECDGGFRFKDWHDWQPTREKVEAERTAARDRMRAARERKKGPRSGSVRPNNSEQDPKFGERSGEVRSTPGSLTPTRPDPTRPVVPTELQEGGDGSGDSGKSAGRKRPATRLPEDWQPTDAHRERATRDGIDLDHELEQFRLHAEANDRRQANWNAAFSQWLGKAKKWSRPAQPSGGTIHHLPHVSQIAEPPDGLSDEEYLAWWHRNIGGGGA